MAWVGMDPQDLQVPTPCHRQGDQPPHLVLDQAAQAILWFMIWNLRQREEQQTQGIPAQESLPSDTSWQLGASSHCTVTQKEMACVR